MKVKIIFILSLYFTIIFSVFADDNSIYSYSLPCLGCHGIKNNFSIPNIFGLDEAYIYSALLEYKLDKRDHYLMSIIAKAYDDKKLKIIAKYFSLKGKIHE